ncbi:serine/threonine protein kinase [Rhizohabitans arisaemae]|uniref:serine/threonine protein kinase n=1 Tax=Rhizohabitans arisaemae TaxID=2720610 RepID=UPI0024B1E7CB|nr:serine/threonine-protein kinase [Rhizohabitans arisaemae]
MSHPLTPEDPRRLDRFTLVARLGEGGQGVVYLGLTPEGEQVAVKVLRADASGDARTRLTREFSAITDVASFCTARVLAASVEGRRPYIVSEFVDGPSLQERVGERGPLRGGDLERLMVGTATALAAIHSAGVIHRDFKPANVLLGPDGPRVVDFGIARIAENPTITSGLIGTPAYLAPEQLSGVPVTPAADIFAWASTMVFAATGQAAFGSDSVAAVLGRVLHHHPDLSSIPERLRAPLADCLAKDPLARPDAQQLLIRLVGPASSSTASQSRPFPTPSPGGYSAAPTQPGRVGRGGRGRLIGVIAGAAAVLLVGGVAVWQLTSPSADPGGERGTDAAPATSSRSSDEPTGAEPEESPSESKAADNGGTVIPAGFHGTWRGNIKNTKTATNYDITVMLARGERKGRWEEPANSCSGDLAVRSVSGSTLTVRLENIDGACVPGDITLTKNGNAIDYEWSDDLGIFTYVGVLQK